MWCLQGPEDDIRLEIQAVVNPCTWLLEAKLRPSVELVLFTAEPPLRLYYQVPDIVFKELKSYMSSKTARTFIWKQKYRAHTLQRSSGFWVRLLKRPRVLWTIQEEEELIARSEVWMTFSFDWQARLM